MTQEESDRTKARDTERAAAGKPQDFGQRRQMRVHEHMGEILESADTLQACMGPVLCDTLEMCHMLKAALTEKIGNERSPMAGVEASKPLLQLYLQIVRQAERLANLDCRIRESQARPE